MVVGSDLVISRRSRDPPCSQRLQYAARRRSQLSPIFSQLQRWLRCICKYCKAAYENVRRAAAKNIARSCVAEACRVDNWTINAESTDSRPRNICPRCGREGEGDWRHWGELGDRREVERGSADELVSNNRHSTVTAVERGRPVSRIRDSGNALLYTSLACTGIDWYPQLQRFQVRGRACVLLLLAWCVRQPLTTADCSDADLDVDFAPIHRANAPTRNTPNYCCSAEAQRHLRCSDLVACTIIRARQLFPFCRQLVCESRADQSPRSFQFCRNSEYPATYGVDLLWPNLCGIYQLDSRLGCNLWDDGSRFHRLTIDPLAISSRRHKSSCVACE